MPHNDYINPAGQWFPETVPEPGMLRRLDQQISEGVNGDDGSTWNPTAPITVGGSGIQIYSTGGLQGAIGTGKRALDGGALILGDSDYPVLSPSITKTTLVPIRDFYTRADRHNEDDTIGPAAVGTGSSAFYPYDASTPGSVVNNDAPLFFSRVAKATYLVGPIDPIDLVQGATITRIVMLISLRSVPAATQTVFPGFRILRVFGDGSFVEVYKIPNRQNTHAYLLGDLVIPAAPNGRQFRCITAGTSGGSEPGGFLVASPGGIVGDAGVAWRCETGPTGASGHFCTMPWVATGVEYYAGGGVQEVAMTVGTGITIAGPLFNNVVALDGSVGAEYALEIYDPSVVTIGSSIYAYHGLKFTMTVDKLRATY